MVAGGPRLDKCVGSGPGRDFAPPGGSAEGGPELPSDQYGGGAPGPHQFSLTLRKKLRSTKIKPVSKRKIRRRNLSMSLPIIHNIIFNGTLAAEGLRLAPGTS